ncbi:MAG: cupin domain-containing protein [Gammaproteobacteria bacterium]|nr:cupin domain-containing protein [Gammaproteobacteria bacterium]
MNTSVRRYPLGTLSAEEFLHRYWQKAPLCIRGALASFTPPFTPEELAGLALESEVESRLVQEHPSGQWQVSHGPFSEEDFTTLPESHWTLLVQEMNRHVPEMALLLQQFSFLPGWLLDDVMVSFAPIDGSVGPHADNYDVFIIQGSGRRRWQISHQSASAADLLPNLPLRIHAHFVSEEEWILEAGDLLYIPAGMVHHGVALEDSLSYSVGFRPPAIHQLIASYVDDYITEARTRLEASQEEEPFLYQPNLRAASHSGEITLQTQQQVAATVASIPLDTKAIGRWFGRYITETTAETAAPYPAEELTLRQLRERLSTQGELWRSEYFRFSYIRGEDQQTYLYVGGEEYPLPSRLQPLIEMIASDRRFSLQNLATAIGSFGEGWELLLTLYNRGALFFPDVDP